MAGLFDEQASLYAEGTPTYPPALYAEGRPTYPPALFSYLASLTPKHERVWDVGTGNGQAALALAEHYKEVIATDVSEEQIACAPRRDNIRYACTPAAMSAQELRDVVGEDGSLDLITVAQALHWFDLPHFYAQAARLLRAPGGVVAAWCYTAPRVNARVDAVFDQFYRDSGPFWGPPRELVDDEYRGLPFPFKPVPTGDGQLGTGPVRFAASKEVRVEAFLTYLGSFSVLQCARRKGVELLDQDRVNAFRAAWGDQTLRVTWPVFLRVGTVSPP